jgi:hypothetical protein
VIDDTRKHFTLFEIIGTVIFLNNFLKNIKII